MLLMELCRPLQTKHRTSLQKHVEDAGPLYRSKKSRSTSSSFITWFLSLLHLPTPAVPGTMHRSSRHLSEAQPSKHTQTSPCQEADIFLSLSLPWLPDPIGSVSMRLFIFLIFNTANPAWSLLNYFHTCQDSGAGHSKVWALRRERR